MIITPTNNDIIERALSWARLITNPNEPIESRAQLIKIFRKLYPDHYELLSLFVSINARAQLLIKT